MGWGARACQRPYSEYPKWRKLERRKLTLPWTTECSPNKMTLAGAETIKAGIIGLDIFLDSATLLWPLVWLLPLEPLGGLAMILHELLLVLRCAWVDIEVRTVQG